jgi:hypothetical protein
MNLSEKRRAEQMIRAAFDNREGGRLVQVTPMPSSTLVKEVERLSRVMDTLLDKAHFRRDSRGNLSATNDHPDIVKARTEYEARLVTLRAERDETVRRVWADELTWDDIKKVQSQK